MRKNLIAILAAIILLLIIFSSAISKFYTDWLWFGEVGYQTVFTIRVMTRAVLGLSGGLLFFAIVYFNLLIARKLAPRSLPRYDSNEFRLRMSTLAEQGLGIILFIATAFIAILVGIKTSTYWMKYQMFTHATEFGQLDPIFGKDIGFYIFRLDVMNYIYGWLMFTLMAAVIGTAVVHYLGRAVDFLAGIPTFAPKVKAHLSVLIALILLIKALGYRLDAYNLLYSSGGYMFGAGYADIHARLLSCNVLTVAAIVAAVLVLINISRRGIRLAMIGIIGLFGLSILMGGIVPGMVQQFVVSPNELNKESKYIGYNIDATREAFKLGAVEKRAFPALVNLNAAKVEQNRPTINSIRLWDYRVLDKTYSQLQELWQYYKISNVDIDRYEINGQLRQVTLAARELSLAEVSSDIATWVNKHFQYTHGYGAVMSPVNRATQEGQPDFFLKGLPPQSNVGVELTKPQIYFGEMTDEYAIVNTAENEFDYPSEGKPMYTKYEGIGGIPIGGYFNRLLFSLRFADIKLILSNPITSESRMIFHRNIEDRVKTIFPFLRYDDDPYLVVANGRLYWMWDAYTASRRYPYSTLFKKMDGYYLVDSYNYIRNAAKVVIDAYDGTVNFYIADNTDPIVNTYSKIFPGVLKPMSEMPEALRNHIRYPAFLFGVQTQMLLVYHMQDPHVFYNKGDQWDIPREIVSTNSAESPMEPYYVVMKLPGEQKEEFVIIQPFTPVGRDKNNMIAWIAAKCGPEEYGRMILYTFPKKELIYGPAQIESRIRQDDKISPLISLWNQQQSKVNWGNLLVIPIEKSILYVKPLYLESETSKIPELKQVIVAYGNKIEMQPTLDAALAQIFGGDESLYREAAKPVDGTKPSPDMQTTTSITPEIRKLTRRAAELLERAQEAQRKGDWAGYGKQMRLLEETLRSLHRAANR